MGMKNPNRAHTIAMHIRLARILCLAAVFCLIFYPAHCFAQRRGTGTPAQTFQRRGSGMPAGTSTGYPDEKGDEDPHYEAMLETGLGNISYDIYSGVGSSNAQSMYIGDMVSMKSLFMVRDVGNALRIEVSGELFGTSYRLERWYSDQKLFRINKLMAQGLCMEAHLNYDFEETALYPLPVLARPRMGLGFVYRFHALRRKDSLDLITLPDAPPVPQQTDFALFGCEPNLGFDFTMGDRGVGMYFDIGTGFYGASVENGYAGSTLSSSPEKTTAKSISGRIGLKGSFRTVNYHLGYSIFRMKIRGKETIPESSTRFSRIVCRVGMRF